MLSILLMAEVIDHDKLSISIDKWPLRFSSFLIVVHLQNFP